MNISTMMFENNTVRITENDGAVWFVLRDVLAAMGTTTRPAIAKDDIEQGLGAGYTTTTMLDTGYGVKEATIVSEAAVTFLVSRSNTETGKRLA
jgi:prophage antirepressor-like protein